MAVIRKYYLILFVLFTGCDDTHIDRMRLELMEKRLAALEAQVSKLNDNITALQSLVEMLKNKKQIISVREETDGYTLVMSDQSIIRIYDGKDGADGEDGGVVMPVVSVRDSSDGHTYWTLDGKFLLDAGGRPVRADGEMGMPGTSGESGTPGVIPKIRVNPDTNEWETSVDGGLTWISTGAKATGDKGDTGEDGTPGDAVFAPGGINVQEQYIEFTLSDGTQFRLPRYSELSLQFPQGTDYIVPLGTTRLIPFTITFTTGIPVVNALDNGGWLAGVCMDADKKDCGVIAVTAPPVAGSGSVIVLLDDGEGRCWTYRLTLTAVPASE